MQLPYRISGMNMIDKLKHFSLIISCIFGQFVTAYALNPAQDYWSNAQGKLVRVSLQERAKRPIGRINDEDVSFAWLHRPMQPEVIGFRMRLTMMPKFGPKGVEREASESPLHDVNVQASVGAQNLEKLYTSDVQIKRERGNKTLRVKEEYTEYKEEWVTRPDGNKELRRTPVKKTREVTKRVSYNYYSGEFDAIFEVPRELLNRSDIVLNVRYGDARHVARWTWSDLGTITGGGSREPLRQLAVLPIYIMPQAQLDDLASAEQFVVNRLGDLKIDWVRSGTVLDVIRRRKIDLGRTSDTAKQLGNITNDLKSDGTLYIVIENANSDSVRARFWYWSALNRKLSQNGIVVEERSRDQRLATERMINTILRRIQDNP